MTNLQLVRETANNTLTRVSAFESEMIPFFRPISLRSVQKRVRVLTCPMFSRVVVCLDPLPSIMKWFPLVKGALSAGMLWYYDNSWAGDVNQVSNSTRLHLERGHRVITHARQRTLSHHVSLLSRDAMASIPSFWHYATEL